MAKSFCKRRGSAAHAREQEAGHDGSASCNDDGDDAYACSDYDHGGVTSPASVTDLPYNVAPPCATRGPAPTPTGAPNTAAKSGVPIEASKAKGARWFHAIQERSLALLVIIILIGAGHMLISPGDDPAKVALAEFVKSKDTAAATRQGDDFENLPVDKYQTYSVSTCVQGRSKDQVWGQAQQTMKIANFPGAPMGYLLASMLPDGPSGLTTQNYVSATTVDPEDDSKAHAFAAFFSSHYSRGQYSVCFSSAGHEIWIGNVVAGYEVEERPYLVGYRSCGFFGWGSCPVWDTRVVRTPKWKTGHLSIHCAMRLAHHLEDEMKSKARLALPGRLLGGGGNVDAGSMTSGNGGAVALPLESKQAGPGNLG